MAFCNSCENVVFNPIGTSLDDFEAILHPNPASLARSAELRHCRLCVALYGMIQHQELGFPAGYDHKDTSGRQHVSLGLNYSDSETSDDWLFIDEEVGRHEGDAPEALVVRNIEFACDFRICNPESVARSSWDDVNPDGMMVSAGGLDVTTVPPEPAYLDASTGSTVSIDLMRSWADKCEQEHVVCKRKNLTATTRYPARLLDISNAEGESGMVFLVSFSGSDREYTRPPYATLSHRWKPGHSCVTTSQTEEEFIRDGIPTTKLTRTFREASITAQRLGLRYIWIDSLCILQDDPTDKEREIPKMADYYQNAELNIAAATGHHDGLWQQRDGQATRPFNIIATINTPHLETKTRRTVIRIAPILEGTRSHLDSRGWILQERIFPRRTLFFDPYWVSFECAEMSASECCPEGLAKDHSTNSRRLQIETGTLVARDASLGTMGGMLRDLSAQVASGRALDSAGRKTVMTMWFDILKEYSLRRLSFESDRLDAVSSLAQRLAGILQDEYVGGLWKNDILTCLQWSHAYEDGYQFATRGHACGAPTWSWASVGYDPDDSRGGGVAMDSLYSTATADEAAGAGVPLVRVLDLNWSPRSAGNPFGNLSEARITLSGRLLRGYAYRRRAGPDVWREMVTHVAEDLDELPQERITHHPDYNSEGYKSYAASAFSRNHWWIHVCGERAGERARLIMMLNPDTRDCVVEDEEGGCFLHLLPLADYPAPKEGALTLLDRQAARLFCLVLKELADGTFERVGCVRVSAKYLMKAKERTVVLV